MAPTDKAIQLTPQPDAPASAGTDTDHPDTGAAGAAAVAIGGLDRDELAELYAYPSALVEPWIRANFISSIDGAVAVDGVSGGLSTPADQQIYHLLRSLCDVVLVGSGTVVAENYGPVDFDSTIRDHRTEAGLAPVPPIAVVTASARVPADHRLFGPSAVPPIVLTSEAADEDRVAALTEAGARVIRLPGETVEPAAIRDALGRLHLLRVLCEGGPSLVGSLIDAAVLDEFCLTTAPILCAGRSGRVATSAAGAALRAHRAVLLTDDDGTVATRWVIDRDSPSR